MPARENTNAIRIPQRAVQEIQGKQSVLIVGAENKVAVRDIVAKNRIGTDWIVDSGINPGELVVTDGVSKAKPGAVVKPVFAAAQANAAPANPAPQTPPPAASGK